MPSWQDLASTPGTTPPTMVLATVSTASLSQEDGSGVAQNTAIAGVPHPVIWPADTEIIFAEGSRRVSLMLQRPGLRRVIHDAFENVQASLLFDHAFPDPFVTPLTIRGALIAAADNPRTLNIRNRLISDEEYIVRLIPLVSTRWPNYDLTDGVFSHVHTFPFSVQVSGIVVHKLYKLHSWVLGWQLTSRRVFRDSWQTIGTPSRWHCM